MNQSARTRTTGIAALCALLAPTISVTGSTASAAESPNVVMVLVDDARLDDLSTMPYVQQMIGGLGATFSQSYAPYPVCAPDRATLLTGQYAHNHGVLTNSPTEGGFAQFRDAQTIATWLDPAYQTGFTGKYINGYGLNGTKTYVPPGWDEWHASLSPENYVDPAFNDNGVASTHSGQYITNVVADQSVDFINTSSAGAEPFFLMASFPAPHNGTPAEADDPVGYPTPNVGPRTAPGHGGQFENRPLDPVPSFNEDPINDKPVKPVLLTQADIDAITELDQQRAESLLYVEDAVKRIIAALGTEINNTYIIFTSDNGFLLGEHRLTGKGTPYEESIGVPLLIRGPNIPQGSVVRQQTGAMDIAPTILGMTGRTAAPGFVIDGVNALPMISNASLYADRPIVLEVGPTQPGGAYAYHGIRTSQWKYVERLVRGRLELYDLVADPYELSNRARPVRYDADEARMKALLDQYIYCAGAACR